MPCSLDYAVGYVRRNAVLFKWVPSVMILAGALAAGVSRQLGPEAQGPALIIGSTVAFLAGGLQLIVSRGGTDLMAGGKTKHGSADAAGWLDSEVGQINRDVARILSEAAQAGRLSSSAAHRLHTLTEERAQRLISPESRNVIMRFKKSA